MKPRIYHEGDHPVWVIIDHDTTNNLTLDAGVEDLFDATDGIIELCEFEIGQRNRM